MNKRQIRKKYKRFFELYDIMCPCHGCISFDIFVKKSCFNCIRLPSELRDDNYQSKKRR